MKAHNEGRVPDPQMLFELAEKAEEAGINSVWVGDSLVSKPRLEPIATMAGIAARTKRVRIGTAVLLPAIRKPIPLAHSLATVDILSGGRLVVACGVGGAFTPEQRLDWVASGVNPGTRAGIFTETVQILKRLWLEDSVTFKGKYFEFDDINLKPRPVQNGGIPLLLGTHFRSGSEAQINRVAKHGDGVMGISDYPEEFARLLAKVRQATLDQGRNPDELEHVFYMTVNINENAAEARREAEEFLMAYYGIAHWGDRWGPWGSPSQIVERMREYARAGAQHLIVRFASWNQADQWDRFITEVMPSFRSA